MNILTFDVEEWYLYNLFPKGGGSYFLPIINNYLDKLLDSLDKHKIHATFFCLGVIAREYPNVIKKIHRRGHEIGCHSDKHKILTSLNPKAFILDTKTAIESLEQVIGSKVISYRAPAFSITQTTTWALEIIAEHGIKFDSSIFNGKRRRGGFDSFDHNKPVIIELNNGIKIKEFVINNREVLYWKLFYTGGGYYRLLPNWIIKNSFKQSNYNMSYFHIRDFDAFQKRIISYKYPISYWGVKSAYSKFECLLDEFNFISLGQASDIYDWESSPKVKVNNNKLK